MEKIEIIPHNVCARKITIYHENYVIKDALIEGGCHGNGQAVSHLIKGLSFDEVISRLSGIKCRGSRNQLTSCANELASGLKEHLK